MPVVSEVAELVGKLSEVVKNTREIIDAVNDGKKYLELKFPEAKHDFSELLAQMQLTVNGLSNVTKIIHGFRFAFHESVSETEPALRELARFNDYTIEQKKDITELENKINKLKADCEKIRSIRDKLDAGTKSRAWGSLFELLGIKKAETSLRLHDTLSNFYSDDQRMIELVQKTLHLAKNAIEEVESTLGPPGSANPYNLPIAANTLGTYAMLFKQPQVELTELAAALSEAHFALINK